MMKVIGLILAAVLITGMYIYAIGEVEEREEKYDEENLKDK